jgi:hypothetical protein
LVRRFDSIPPDRSHFVLNEAGPAMTKQILAIVVPGCSPGPHGETPAVCSARIMSNPKQLASSDLIPC